MENIFMPYPCQILNIKEEGENEYTFRVATDAKPQHGQFMQLSIPKIGEAPISVSRQGDGWLEFTIRSVGKVTNVIFKKRVGDTIFLRGPYGHGWPVDEIKGKNLVVITGGTGLAPVRSLLNQCESDKNFARSVTLVSGFKNYEGVIFHEELERWKKEFTTIYSLDNEERTGWKTGLVTKFIPEIDWKSFGDNYAVIIVGPPIMMKFASLEALKCGASEDKMWMSFERKMCCGNGKCGHCRINEVYVCQDGPVFPYTKAKYLVD